MTITATAPGKIVLAGEYAVLWDAPAICMAVNRRAVATIETGADGQCRVSTPGFEGKDRFAVVDAVTEGQRPSGEIELDTTAFAENGRKVGIGSSAAVTVALAAALGNTTGVYEKSLAAHQRLQGGGGSGIDVAAAVYGGLFEYTRTEYEVSPLSWPEGLAFRVIWTGISASTAARIERLANQAKKASRSALLLAAPRIADAWRVGDAGAILSEYVTYIGVLRQFSVDHDLGIFDAGHDELTDAAMVDGLVYKPAGAGGGDIGIVFGRNEAELDAFVLDRGELIHGVLSCDLDPDGVRLEPR
jgi:phosphomevalonate kinase